LSRNAQGLLGKRIISCYNISTQKNICVSINKSACLGIIIPAVQVVEPRLRIVVIPSVTEGIIPCCRRGATVGVSNGLFTPRIVGIGNQERAALIVNRDNIALQVFAVQITVKPIFNIPTVPILHADGRARSVVDIENQMVKTVEHQKSILGRCGCN